MLIVTCSTGDAAAMLAEAREIARRNELKRTEIEREVAGAKLNPKAAIGLDARGHELAVRPEKVGPDPVGALVAIGDLLEDQRV